MSCQLTSSSQLNLEFIQIKDYGVLSGCFLRNSEDVTTKSAGLYPDHQLSKKAGEVMRKYDQQALLFLYLASQSIQSLCRYQTSMSGGTKPYRGLTTESRRRGMDQ